MSEPIWQAETVDAAFAADPRAWLAARMTAEMPWLLAHADDGVIWGRREPDGALILSSDVFSSAAKYPAIAVPLRALTLQQARIFGPGGELLLWRTDGGFAARRIADGANAEDIFEEDHLLWGTRRQFAIQAGFTLRDEGEQGPQHAVPLEVGDGERAALRVRHCVAYDPPSDMAYVALSRLVDLIKVEGSAR